MRSSSLLGLALVRICTGAHCCCCTGAAFLGVYVCIVTGSAGGANRSEGEEVHGRTSDDRRRFVGLHPKRCRSPPRTALSRSHLRRVVHSSQWFLSATCAPFVSIGTDGFRFRWCTCARFSGYHPFCVVTARRSTLAESEDAASSNQLVKPNVVETDYRRH